MKPSSVSQAGAAADAGTVIPFHCYLSGCYCVRISRSFHSGALVVNRGCRWYSSFPSSCPAPALPSCSGTTYHPATTEVKLFSASHRRPGASCCIRHAPWFQICSNFELGTTFTHSSSARLRDYDVGPPATCPPAGVREVHGTFKRSMPSAMQHSSPHMSFRGQAPLGALGAAGQAGEEWSRLVTDAEAVRRVRQRLAQKLGQMG